MQDAVAAPPQIDPSTCADVAERLCVPGDGDVVLDCSAIEFIDSSGLRTLIQSRTTLAETDRNLVLRRPSPVLARLLQITDTEHLFTIER